MSWRSVPCLVGLLAVAGCDGCAGRTNEARTARREPDLIGRRVPVAFDGWLSRARLIAIDGKPMDPMPWSD